MFPRAFCVKISPLCTHPARKAFEYTGALSYDIEKQPVCSRGGNPDCKPAVSLYSVTFMTFLFTVLSNSRNPSHLQAEYQQP